MSEFNQAATRNQLLRSMTPDAFATLQPHLEPIRLDLRDPLNEPNQPTEFVYFIEEGIGSIVLGPERTTGVEVGIVGREGLVGTSVILGAGQSPHSCFIQLPGSGYRIRAEALTAALARSVALRDVLLRYAHVHMVQLASTAHANADYTVEERLARWILMCHDRIDGDDLAMTHEFIALMLGVRRPGVTVATHVLEGERLIRAKRGLITILDREGLRKRADLAYGVTESEYARLIGPIGENLSTVVRFPQGTSGSGPTSTRQ